MTESVVVFGGSGFIGTHLVRRLTSNGGDCKIISVDIRKPRERISGVEYREADVRNLDSFELGANVTRIYNLAAVHTTPGHPNHEYYETNVAGALEITKLAERCGVNNIVFTSSISVYGPSEEMKTEASTPSPVSAYGRSKLLAEQVHNAWLDRGTGRTLTIVRPAVVFGPGEGGNFTRMAALLARGIFIYPGRKDTIKACIYVEDLLDAIEYARINNAMKVIFNGAYPERYTLEQIVGTLIRNHFPRAHTVLIPRAAVAGIARVLGFVDVFQLGIHPERVTKLVQSTDIYPRWLTDNGFKFPTSLEDVLMRWSKQTDSSFV